MVFFPLNSQRREKKKNNKNEHVGMGIGNGRGEKKIRPYNTTLYTYPENRVFRSSAGLGSGVSLSCPVCAFCPAAMSPGRTGRTCRSSPLRASLWPETGHTLLFVRNRSHTLYYKIYTNAVGHTRETFVF